MEVVSVQMKQPGWGREEKSKGRKRPGEDIGDKNDNNDGAHLEKVLLGPDEMVAKREKWDQFDLQEVKELEQEVEVLKVGESRMLQSSALSRTINLSLLLQIKLKIESIRRNEMNNFQT